MIDGRVISFEIAFKDIPKDVFDDKLSLVPSGDTPIPEPILTELYDVIWCF